MPNQRLTAFIALAVLSVLVFWPSLFNQFTNWDDDKFLTVNPIVQDFSWENLKAIWTMRFEDGYQPLTMLSFAIEHYFVKLNPFVYHLDNLILHIANVWLVYLIIAHLTKRSMLAFVTALLFAIHPLRVESVAWVAERKDVLFSFFYLLAIWAYLKNHVRLCFVLFIAACLAKHQAVSLPAVLLLIDGNISFKAILRKTPFFIASVVFLLAAVTSAAPHWDNIHMYSWVDKLFLMNYAVLIYFVKTVIPYQLCCVYASPEKINNFFPWFIYASPLIVLGLIGLAFKTIHSSRWISFGILFFLITIALPLATVWYGGIFIFDRYTYLPSIGIFLIIAYLCVKKNVLSVAVLTSYVLAMSWMTFERCKVWFNGVTLWSDAIKQYPKYANIYDKRGTAYCLMGQDDLALEDFTQAIRLDSHYAGSYNNRAYVYLKRGQVDLALGDYNEAIKENPNFVLALFNRSRVYAQLGYVKESTEDALKARTLASP